jgi:hypothetical protein
LNLDPGYIQIWKAPVDPDRCKITLDDTDSREFNNHGKYSLYQGENLPQSFVTQVKAFEVSSVHQRIIVQPVDVLYSYEISPVYTDLGISVFPSEYINLNNFSEIVQEILPGVKLVSGGNGLSIRILDDINGVYFEEEPLVLINGVPFQNYNYLASLNSSDIERIDIVRRLFTIGSLLFPGVLSVKLHSKLPSEQFTGDNIRRVQSQTISMRSKIMFPEYDTEDKIRSRQPDFRNTLFWNPNLKMSSDDEQIVFYTSDMSGRYRICVEGLVNGRIPVSATRDFFVKNKY